MMNETDKISSAIVLLSGGLDSVVSLAYIKERCKNIFALTFNYGQKSFNSEKYASENISKFYGIEHKIIDLKWLGEISNSALNNKDDVPVISFSDLNDKIITKESAKSVWVPNRNGLFVNIAACFADAYNYEYIVIGANKEEGETFKDNTIEFVNSINKSLSNSAEKNVRLIAPLIEMTKQDIVKEGIQLNVPFKYIHSCYINGEKNCGKCESCKRLKRALELNNRKDIENDIFYKDNI